jgi:hypothetical protein
MVIFARSGTIEECCPRSQRRRSDEELGAKVRASFVASDRTYGARRCGKTCWRQGCRVVCIDAAAAGRPPLRFTPRRITVCRSSCRVSMSTVGAATWQFSSSFSFSHGPSRTSTGDYDLKANWTFNDIRRVNMRGDKPEHAYGMAVEMRELYSSPNGDRWYLVRDVDLGQVFIRHEPNLPSGGNAAHIEIGTFLGRGGQGPEHRELLRLIGTLVERGHSFERGTAVRIKSHAKSYIVELTDGSKWRIWPGDLATTLGWTPEAEIEVLPIEYEFCSHVLVDQSDGSRVRAIDASNDFPVEKLRKFLRRG